MLRKDFLKLTISGVAGLAVVGLPTTTIAEKDTLDHFAKLAEHKPARLYLVDQDNALIDYFDGWSAANRGKVTAEFGPYPQPVSVAGYYLEHPDYGLIWKGNVDGVIWMDDGDTLQVEISAV